ncbi:MAG: hypothetical protein LBR18_03420 [Tannerella sp.]|jgi:hypothetical protein|nr:hypothetical protein [Tannerella sp.]
MKEAYTIFLLFISLVASAQVQTEYNRKGDEAMKRLDYSAAKIFYEEGVDNCNTYSINQLTTIWLADPSMRSTLRIVMGKSLSCLNDLATQNRDTASIKKLILFYKEGIGTSPNPAKEDFWQKQYDMLRNQFTSSSSETPTKPREKTPFNIFIGYSGSFYAPVGLTIGGVGKTVGFYLRFRTNLSFQNYTERCSSDGKIIGLTNSAYQYTGRNRTNILMGSGGLVFRLAPSFLLSAGAGFWSSSLNYEFEKTGLVIAQPEGKIWAKCTDKSEEGVVVDLDGTFLFTKSFYGSIGCSALSFKYVSANAGIGFLF